MRVMFSPHPSSPVQSSSEEDREPQLLLPPLPVRGVPGSPRPTPGAAQEVREDLQEVQAVQQDVRHRQEQIRNYHCETGKK